MKSHPCFHRTISLALAAALSAVTLFWPAFVLARDKTVATVVAQDAQFATLNRALQAAGLVEGLNSQPAATLLAPTDAAFAALPPGTLDKLLQPENKEQLIALLKRHILTVALDADALKHRRQVTALSGEVLKVALVRGRLRINDARVDTRTLRSANGYVLPLDQVLTQ